MVLCVRWYVRYKLSPDLVEMMAERGLSMAHTIIMHWVLKLLPTLVQHWRKRAGAPRTARQTLPELLTPRYNVLKK
jgi:transposase-like protein